MDQQYELVEQDPEIIRLEIDDTRSALTDKLEALEDQVLGTMHNAKETVEETLQTVKVSVQETVATVKRTFDVNHQVQQHPWLMVGGCTILGFAVGRFLQGRSRQPNQIVNGWHENRMNDSRRNVRPFEPRNSPAANSPDAFVSPAAAVAGERPSLLAQFEPEIDAIKGMAIGYAMGLVRDAVKEKAPGLGPQFDNLINGITTKLGGKPVPATE